MIPSLVQAFPQPQFYLSETGINDAIDHKSMFNLLDTSDGGKIDFWILTDDPFDQSRFERKYEENIFGFKMKISRPEDTILAKLRWAKLSGGSQKQFIDAVRVYEVQFAALDMNYFEHWVNELELQSLWNALRDEARPIN